MDKQYKILLPLLMGLMTVLGMFLGTKYENISIISGKDPVSKLREVMGIVQSAYIDTVDEKKLVNDAIRGIFNNLDPHSMYIPKEDLQAINEDMAGDFDGIGILFNVLNDTIIIVEVVPGGPSFKSGIQAGDKIITIDNETVAGTHQAINGVMKKLKGKKGSRVTLGISRNHNKALIVFHLIRNNIPIKSIEASYMVDARTGYIKLNRFAANTYDEFLIASLELKKSGMETLILDLSDNPGGYLNSACKITDEFFDSKKLLVYTQGRTVKGQEYYSTGAGRLKNIKLILIIDENSASASEIMAGAIQDWDRGLLVGRRSFGKGLVQEQINLRDKSAVRLTVARYYTPSGRCIQKPFNKGRNDYYNELLRRFEHGELTNLDSVKIPKNLKYHTSKGRMVYGNGGIMPDVFVPLDTLGNNVYSNELSHEEILLKFAVSYTDKNRSSLKTHYKNFKEFKDGFLINHEILNQLSEFTSQSGIKVTEKELNLSEEFIVTELKGLIARQLFDNNAYYRIINPERAEFIKACQLINSDIFTKSGLTGN